MAESKNYFILADENILLMPDAAGFILPNTATIDEALIETHFDLENAYVCATLTHPLENCSGKFIPLREAYVHLGDELFQLAGRARQLLAWRLDHRFCGRCGIATEYFDQDRAKRCPACGLTNYPKISPCIMVAILKEGEILLARSPHFREGMFSVLAGFVEAAESLENCIHREVFEEVGLQVKNLRYVASQPWPFPNLLMMGFLADYASGEIRVDGVEIEKAEWFRPERLPLLPLPFSLSYRLIQTGLERKAAAC
jgi:NAD+ diphosphatase